KTLFIKSLEYTTLREKLLYSREDKDIAIEFIPKLTPCSAAAT
ncbi:unnamed protein product, partial [marine sediment metagenome]